MSLSIALSNALSGLQVNQTALQVTSSNVANVNTPDYARKIHEQETRVLGGQGVGEQVLSVEGHGPDSDKPHARSPPGQRTGTGALAVKPRLSGSQCESRRPARAR